MQILLHAKVSIYRFADLLTVLAIIIQYACNGDRSMCLASRKESYALVDVKCACSKLPVLR